MKSPFLIVFVIMVCLFGSCDEVHDDIVPAVFENLLLNPDDVYIYNGGSEYGVRLDPLLNDSIKVAVTMSYSTPKHGTIRFIENEGWFYKANAGFYGIDSIRYTACNGPNCGTSLIRMFVEQAPDWSVCETSVQNESYETTRDKPIEIRLFINDTICPFSGWFIRAPQYGKAFTYSYSGSHKNVVYVYTPPKGFTGTDTFRYWIYPNGGGEVAGVCTITVK